MSVTEVEYDLSDYEPYDWTSVSAEGIPETGEVLEMDLEAGSYYVGADLPVGIYTISGSTDCSYRVEDWTHWISIQETFGDPSYGIDTAEEVKLSRALWSMWKVCIRCTSIRKTPRPGR